MAYRLGECGSGRSRWIVPEALDDAGLVRIKGDFVRATVRALAAGFDVVELHCAHGYLLNSFLSPLTNKRDDAYGGDRERRMRLPLEIAAEMRKIWPQDKPMFVRVSAVDNARSGVSIEDTVVFAAALRDLGIDLVDCSSGGIGRHYEHPNGYAYQAPYSARIRSEVGIATMAVGLIVHPLQAENIVADGLADLVAIGREALHDPNFAFHAQQVLNAADADAPFAGWAPRYGWWLNNRERSLRKLGPWTATGNVAA